MTPAIKLIPLKRDQLDLIKDLVRERLVEAGLTNTTPEHCIKTMQAVYDIQCGGVYTDSLENPKHLLSLSHFPDTFISRTICYINLIYSHPSVRGHIGVADTILWTAENYARMNGCDVLQGASWVKDNHKDIGPLYERAGFHKESVQYIKNL